MGKNQDETPKYATLLYSVLQDLDLTISEYFYLDMVYHLSRGGWCYKSLESVAHDMRMHKNGVVKMRNRLISRGLLKKSIKGYVSTTDLYHSVLRQPPAPYHSVTNRTTQCVSAVPLSVTKNNKENYIDKEDFEKAERTKRKMVESLPFLKLNRGGEL